MLDRQCSVLTVRARYGIDSTPVAGEQTTSVKRETNSIEEGWAMKKRGARGFRMVAVRFYELASQVFSCFRDQ